MSNLIDVRGEGPVAIPEDLLSPFGFMSGALYKVLPSDWNWAAYVGAFNAIADARDALRAAQHEKNLAFEDMLWREAERQKRVAYAIPEPSAALRQFETDRENDAVRG